MDIGIYVDQTAARAISDEHQCDLEVVESERLDGVSGEVLVVLPVVALGLRKVLDIVKSVSKQNRSIRAVIDGNEYKNIDKETLIKLIEQHRKKE
jgi:hypothetical protein